MLGESFIGPSGHDKERSGREPVAGGRNGNRDRSVKGDQCPSEFVPISELPAVMEGTGDHPANLLDPHALRQRGEWIRVTIFTINRWLIFSTLVAYVEQLASKLAATASDTEPDPVSKPVRGQRQAVARQSGESRGIGRRAGSRWAVLRRWIGRAPSKESNVREEGY